jgi:hypothetical protein
MEVLREYGSSGNESCDDDSSQPVQGCFEGDAAPNGEVECWYKPIGKGTIRKHSREADSKVLFEWSRVEAAVRGRKRRIVTLNRWVERSELEFLTPEDADTSQVFVECVDDAASASGEQASCSSVAASPAAALPKKAGLHRERVIVDKPSAKKARLPGGQRQTRTHTTKHKSVTQFLLDEFPDEPLVPDVTDEKSVFCRVCKKSYAFIKSSLKVHVESSGHKSKFAVATAKTNDDCDVKSFLEDWCTEHPQEACTTVPYNLQLHRYRIVEALLGNGIALNKVDGLRPVLERASDNALTDRSHLLQYIPKILAYENKRILADIKDQYITFIFDGTTRLGEAVNIVYRFCPADFSKIYLRLADFTTLEKHMNGDELGLHLNEVLTNEVKVPTKFIVGASRDSCATNGAGLRVLKPLLPAVSDFMCYSHMLHCTGCRFDWEVLEDFLTPFLSLHSMALVKTLWMEKTGTVMKGFSKIRWWSRWEVMSALAKAFGPQLDGFVDALVQQEIGEETTRKLQRVLHDAEKRAQLELELALVLDMECFMTTTYILEGDGLCILVAHRMIEQIRALGHSLTSQGSLPNTAAVLRARVPLKEGLAIRQYWSEIDAPGESGWYDGKILKKKPGFGQLCAVKYSNDQEMWINKSEESTLRANIVATALSEWDTCVAKVTPGFKYIHDRMTNECDAPYHMASEHEIARLVQFFDPDFAATHSDNLLDFVTGFSCIPAFKVHNLLSGMQAELPQYVSSVKSFVEGPDKPPAQDDMAAFTVRVLRFWQWHHRKVPTLALAARVVFSWSPNSAPCERVFSLLQAFFGNTRDKSLGDQVCAALKLAYNARALG